MSLKDEQKQEHLPLHVGLLPFYIQVLSTYYVTGAVVGVGKVEVKDGAINNFQQKNAL